MTVPDLDTAAARAVWVTRTAPDNALTFGALGEMGRLAVNVPVLRVRKCFALPRVRSPGGIVLTSVNGVRIHPLRAEFFDIPVFTVGDRTAEAAEMVGYRNVTSANGDVEDLEDLIRTKFQGSRRIYHFSALEPAGDLAGNLCRHGYDAERIAVYRTCSVLLSELAKNLPPLEKMNGILIHSPRASQIVRSYLDAQPRPFVGWIACISPAAAAPFAGLCGVNVLTAERPDERSILELIADIDL